jgi:hypothetical protein
LQLHEAPCLRQAPAVWVDLQPALQDGASHGKPAGGLQTTDDVQDVQSLHKRQRDRAPRNEAMLQDNKNSFATSAHHAVLRQLLQLVGIP